MKYKPMELYDWKRHPEFNPGDGFHYKMKISTRNQNYYFVKEELDAILRKARIKYKVEIVEERNYPYMDSHVYIFTRHKNDMLRLKLMVGFEFNTNEVIKCRPREQVEAERKKKILAENKLKKKRLTIFVE